MWSSLAQFKTLSQNINSSCIKASVVLYLKRVNRGSMMMKMSKERKKKGKSPQGTKQILS